MKYLSVCSGIEAATVAWRPLGWTPVAFAETDRFPSAVLAHHFPDVPNWGDITTFREWPDAAIDLLVGGTPCQSFSVAGLRKGLDDPRGSLMLVYLAIARRYRPTWVVWENVPGALSVDDGRAFGTFLRGLAELGYGFAWRVLDAQYFGLAQRRARVFVVGHLGDWRRAAAVLFERASLSGHPAPRRETGQDVAGTLGGSSQSGGFRTTDLDNSGAFIPEIVPQAMSAKWAKGSSGPAGDEVANLVAHTLRADGFDASEDGTGRGTPLGPVAFDWQSGGDSRGLDPKATAQLQCSQVPTVAFQATDVRQGMQVRRLTPRECERLMGFPDDYTLIPTTAAKRIEADYFAYLRRTYPSMDRATAERLAKDGPRYKALGNSIAVPVLAWIGRRIQLVSEIPEE